MWLLFSNVPFVPPPDIITIILFQFIIVKNCLKIWTQLKHHLGLQSSSLLSPVLSNPLFTPSINNRAFAAWEDHGIVSVKHLTLREYLHHLTN